MARWSALRELGWAAPRLATRGARCTATSHRARGGLGGLAARRRGRRPSRARARHGDGGDGRGLRAGLHRASRRALRPSLHSGWRGTAARITERAIERFEALGLRRRRAARPLRAGDLRPVLRSERRRLRAAHRARPGQPTTVDLRALIADHARALGVRDISISPLCTRCDNDRFFSHRAGDAGRQLGRASLRAESVTARVRRVAQLDLGLLGALLL